MYDLANKMPEYGSLAEAAFLLVWKARQSEVMARTRATAQAALGGDKAVEAFNDYATLVNRAIDDSQQVKIREKLEQLQEMKTIKFSPTDDSHKKTKKLRTIRRN